MTEKDIEVVSSAIDKEEDNLDRLSREIWKKPELQFREICAHDLLTNALEDYGFSVQRGYLLETAFRAEYSRGEGIVVAVMCEYDALPEIGHACGHNLIAEAGIAAALGIKASMDSDSTMVGKVVVLGCPAEEGGAGKVRLIEGGALEGIDASLMVHPSAVSLAAPPFLCIVKAQVTYKGKEAHASGFPWEGKNALDAAVAAYVNIGLLRQHIKPMCRIHAIITKGGSATNVIPGEAEMNIIVRAPTLSETNSLKDRVKQCVESAAAATGCQIEYRFAEEDTYLNLISNKVLVSLYKEYSERFGIRNLDDDPEAMSDYPTTAGSTDMGNVSYVVPSLHPLYYIGPRFNHTKEFTEQSGSDSAHRITRSVAKVIALTAVRLLRSPDLVDRAKEAFQRDLEKNKQ